MKTLTAAAVLSLAAGVAPVAQGEGAIDAITTAGDAFEVLRGGEPVERAALAEIQRRFEEAAEREPRAARWRIGLAFAASAGQNWAEARRHAEEAADIEPEIAHHHYLVGLYALKQLEREESMSIARKARRHLETAIELDPEHTDARTLLGCYYAIAPGFVGGSIERASEQADALDKIDGGRFGSHVVRARIAVEREKWSEMEQACDAAAAEADSMTRLFAVRLRQAETLLLKAERPDEALAILNNLPDSENTSDMAERWRLRGVVLQSLGHNEEAAADFEEAVALAPSDAEAAYRLARCYAEMDKHERAMRWYRASLRISPDHDEARSARRALKRLERLARAG